MKHLIIRFRSLLVFFSTVAFIFFVGYSVVRPMWRQNMELLDRMQAVDVEQDIVKQQSGQLSDLRAQSELIGEHREMFRTRVSADDPLGWVETLERSARDAGVSITIESNQSETINGIAPSKTVPAAASSEDGEGTDAKKKDSGKDKDVGIADTLPSDRYVSVRLTLSGQYPDLRFFLRKLEYLSFYVDVLSVGMDYVEPEKQDRPAANPFVAVPISSGGGGIETQPVQEEQQPEGKGSVKMVLDAVIYTE